MKRASLLTVLLAAATCSTSGEPPATEDGVTTGPTAEPPFERDGTEVTIVTKVDPSGPLGGTFTVKEGAAALGCSSGTYVDGFHDFGHRKAFTCEAGEMSGTFTVRGSSGHHRS